MRIMGVDYERTELWSEEKYTQKKASLGTLAKLLES